MVEIKPEGFVCHQQIRIDAQKSSEESELEAESAGA